MSDCMKCRYVSKEPYQEPCNRCKSNVSMSIDRFEPMTNADKIRAMSDEELAKFLGNYEFNQCDFCNMSRSNCCDSGCSHHILEWLQSEVKKQ